MLDFCVPHAEIVKETLLWSCNTLQTSISWPVKNVMKNYCSYTNVTVLLFSFSLYFHIKRPQSVCDYQFKIEWHDFFQHNCFHFYCMNKCNPPFLSLFLFETPQYPNWGSVRWNAGSWDCESCEHKCCIQFNTWTPTLSGCQTFQQNVDMWLMV